MKYALQRLLEHAGFRVIRRYPLDLTPDVVATIKRVRPYTMTSTESIAALCAATDYVVRNQIPGALVECGVWRGGSMMAVALTLLRLGVQERQLYLYDTFGGMPEPTEHDIRWDGLSAKDPRSMSPKIAVSVQEVVAAMRSTGYDESRVQLVRGRVEETLPARAPDGVALLRLDTDWYESTKHELVHLYPRLAPGGVLIIDDYGQWRGVRRAVNEYIEEENLRLLLCRVDYTVRIAVKQ